MEKTTVDRQLTEKKKNRVAQTNFPLYTIEEALCIPRAIKDNFAGQSTVPLLVAKACGISPTSSKWRYILGTSSAYGLTEGSYSAKEISLTLLGDRIVSPIKEGDDDLALIEAVLMPSILGKLYKKYNGNKIPNSDILKNILQKEGVPTDRLNEAVAIFRENAVRVKIVQTINGNEFIFLDVNSGVTKNEEILPSSQIVKTESSEIDGAPSPDLLTKMNIDDHTPTEVVPDPVKPVREKPHIFISHGKTSKTIVEQLKELLSYGQMEPIVSVDREATAIPVPDKVFDDMRNCDGGIIHVDTEEVAGDNGNSFNRLNQNVLIEIGAAFALYGKQVILLCKKGTELPSNLQGLYRCEYEGNQLDYAATMKILKTLQELRGMMK